MSRSFIAESLQKSTDITKLAATQAARALVEALVRDLKKQGVFNIPGFGTFRVRKTKARIGVNPRTGEKVKIRAGKTVRFKPSITLRRSI